MSVVVVSDQGAPKFLSQNAQGFHNRIVEQFFQSCCSHRLLLEKHCRKVPPGDFQGMLTSVLSKWIVSLTY